jgi:hypothetical protein
MKPVLFVWCSFKDILLLHYNLHVLIINILGCSQLMILILVLYFLLGREVFMKSVYPDYQRLMESWIIVGVAAPARMPVKLKNQKTINNHKNQKTKIFFKKTIGFYQP